MTWLLLKVFVVAVSFAAAMIWLYSATNEYLKKCRMEGSKDGPKYCPDPLMRNFLVAYTASSLLSLCWLALSWWLSAVAYTLDAVLYFVFVFLVSMLFIMMGAYVLLVQWIGKRKERQRRSRTQNPRGAQATRVLFILDGDNYKYLQWL